DGKHVHRAALALGVTSASAGQLCHHTLGIHAASEHMAVVAISGDDLVPGLDCHLHADDDRLLPDVKVAEAADQAHAVELPGLFFESAHEEHLAASVT